MWLSDSGDRSCGVSRGWGRLVHLCSTRLEPRPGPRDAGQHGLTAGPQGGLILGGAARCAGDSAPGSQGSFDQNRDSCRDVMQRGRRVATVTARKPASAGDRSHRQGRRVAFGTHAPVSRPSSPRHLKLSPQITARALCRSARSKRGLACLRPRRTGPNVESGEKPRSGSVPTGATPGRETPRGPARHHRPPLRT